MNKSERLKALLERGYFPAELPPPFNTRDFARLRKSILSAWQIPGQQPPKTIPGAYSIPKIGRVRRQLAIVNPISQMGVAKLIADEWITIRAHLRKNTYSVDTIEISEGPGRAIPQPDFASAAKRSSYIAAAYDYSLELDISRFYATLYTHTIPWALHGKQWCKLNMNAPGFRLTLGDRLDTAIRKGQDNQTIGIPVGPDTSRIISEIIGSSIDTILEQASHFGRDRAYRYVDDWEIGFDTVGDAENTISTIAEACRTYELELHAEKTRITHLPTRRDALWSISLRQRRLDGDASEQARAIEHFFTEALEYASQYPHQNVLEYALKRSLGATIRVPNWPLFETYLLRAARFSPALIPTVTAVLVKYLGRNYQLGRERIAKLVDDTIRKAAPLGHYSEVSWALFICKALNIALPPAGCRLVEKISNSVCALLALDLEQMGLTNGPLNKQLWQSTLTVDGLTSSEWLLSYEADLKGWLHGAQANFAAAHPYFGPLRSRGVSFYDTTKSVYAVGPRGPLPDFEDEDDQLDWFDVLDDLPAADFWY